MINPELIAGMLFLPSMTDNEAIEIVGAERFSNYAGYASSFRYSGDNVDKRNLDSMGRRRTRIIAIDALYNPEKNSLDLSAFSGRLTRHSAAFLINLDVSSIRDCLKMMILAEVRLIKML